jgi:hypothetical protein
LRAEPGEETPTETARRSSPKPVKEKPRILSANFAPQTLQCEAQRSEHNKVDCKAQGRNAQKAESRDERAAEEVESKAKGRTTNKAESKEEGKAKKVEPS